MTRDPHGKDGKEGKAAAAKSYTHKPNSQGARARQAGLPHPAGMSSHFVSCAAEPTKAEHLCV